MALAAAAAADRRGNDAVFTAQLRTISRRDEHLALDGLAKTRHP